MSLTRKKSITTLLAQAAGEPYLIRGWLHIANGEFDDAKSQAAKLRIVDGKNIEAVIIEGLATAMSSTSSPRKDQT